MRQLSATHAYARLKLLSVSPDPTFEDFTTAIENPMQHEAIARNLWRALHVEERRAAIAYIPYMRSFYRDRNCPALPPFTYLVTQWWRGLPGNPLVNRGTQLPEVHAPSIVPAMENEMSNA